MKSFRNELLVILGGMLKVKAEGRPLIHYQSTPHQTLLAIPNFLGQDSESTCFGVRIPEQPPGLDVIPDKNCLYYDAHTYERVEATRLWK